MFRSSKFPQYWIESKVRNSGERGMVNSSCIGCASYISKDELCKQKQNRPIKAQTKFAEKRTRDYMKSKKKTQI